MSINKFENDQLESKPNNWGSYILSDIVEIIGGGTPKTSREDYWGGDIPWLSVVDFNNNNRWVNSTEKTITKKGLENSSTKILKKGQLIISARGTVGEVAQLNKDMAFNQSCYGLNGKEQISNDFLYYLLKYNLNELKTRTHGSVFATITRNTFDQISVNVPPVSEQHLISDILTSLDKKIQLNRQMNTTLEQMAQAIFKHWFIDFEFPDENGQPYRSNSGEMVDSELGEIPAGWEVVRLPDVCEYIMSGGTPRTKIPEYWNGDIPWLSSGETRNHFITKTEKSISKIGVENSSTRLARSRSTVIASAGQGHTRGQTSLLLLDSYINQSVVSLASDNKHISDLYLFFNLSRRYDEMRRISDSHSSRGSLTTKLLGNLKVACPPIDLIRKFDQIAEPIVNQIHYNLEQVDTLSQLRDSLLPKLMSGKIRINY